MLQLLEWAKSSPRLLNHLRTQRATVNLGLILALQFTIVALWGIILSLWFIYCTNGLWFLQRHTLLLSGQNGKSPTLIPNGKSEPWVTSRGNLWPWIVHTSTGGVRRQETPKSRGCNPRRWLRFGALKGGGVSHMQACRVNFLYQCGLFTLTVA